MSGRRIGSPEHKVERDLKTVDGVAAMPDGTTRYTTITNGGKRIIVKDADGNPVLLRMVKSPLEWTDDRSRSGAGHTEIQDTLIDGVPCGIGD